MLDYTKEELLSLIEELNGRKDVNGIPYIVMPHGELRTEAQKKREEACQW